MANDPLLAPLTDIRKWLEAQKVQDPGEPMVSALHIIDGLLHRFGNVDEECRECKVEAVQLEAGHQVTLCQPCWYVLRDLAGEDK